MMPIRDELQACSAAEKRLSSGGSRFSFLLPRLLIFGLVLACVAGGDRAYAFDADRIAEGAVHGVDREPGGARYERDRLESDRGFFDDETERASSIIECSGGIVNTDALVAGGDGLGSSSG